MTSVIKLYMDEKTSATEICQLAKEQALKIKDQVALDIANYLDNYPNKSFGVRILAKESGLNEKTIKRLLSRSNKPSYPTLLRLYSATTNQPVIKKMLELCPDVIRKEIQDKCPNDIEKRNFSKINFLEMLESDPLIGEIFALAGAGPLYKDSITFKYGQYGLELIERLVNLDILVQTDKKVYELGKNIPTIDGPVIKHLGSRLVKKYCKPQNANDRGQNIMNFFVEGLNEEGLCEWLKIEEESYYKKINISKNPKYRGHKPVFTFCAIDTLEAGESDD